ncbi:hypothetical protein QEN19_000806 [Hanseniaspora menglaensis]
MKIDETVIGRLIQGNIFEHASKWAIPISILQLILCFLLMGAISEDYLATNVNLLCNSSNLLVSILMAFCNSSPDLISNFVAWYGAARQSSGLKSTADTLALSEVLGACGTIMFIAVGCVLIGFNKIFKHINKLKVDRDFSNKDSDNSESNLLSVNSYQAEITDSFAKDLCTPEYKSELSFLLIPLSNKLSNDLFFFSIGMSLVLVCCITESINFFVCLTLLISYCGFMLNNIRHHKKHGNKLINYENVVEDTIELQEAEENFLVNQQQEADTIFKQQAKNSSFFDDGNLEFFLSVLEEEDNDVWRDDNYEDTILNLDLGTELDLSNDRASNIRQLNEMALDHYSDNPADELAMTNTPIVYENLTSNFYQKNYSKLAQKTLQLLLPYFQNINKKTRIRRLISLFTAPVILLITLTCPRFGKSVPKSQNKFWLLILQSYLSGFFLIFSIMVFINKCVIWILIVSTAIFGSGLCYVQIQMRKKYLNLSKLSLANPFSEFQVSGDDDISDNDQNDESLQDEFRKPLSVFSSVGIVNSILWIVIMSNNLIGTIEYYQKVFDISETILGMTFFAWGNSVPDILTNVAVLKLYDNDLPKQILGNSNTLYKWQVQSLIKYAHISLVTCISSSTINSMIGIGFNALVAICLKKPFKISWSLDDIGRKTQIHLLLSSAFILSFMFLIAAILKFAVKNDSFFQHYVIDGYFLKKELVYENMSSRKKQNLQASEFSAESVNNLPAYNHNKIIKYTGLLLIAMWLLITFINVLIEVVM